MTTMVPPKINTQYILYLSLPSAGNLGLIQANPTLAAGDVKVSTDGGAFANLGTLPTVTPAAGKAVKMTLSTTEMNGDNILVVFSDQTSPAEWLDIVISIQTSARQIDDLAFPTVSGRGLDVSAGGEAGLDWANIGSPTTAQGLTGTTIATSQVVASVTGNVGGNVTGSVGSVVGAVGSVAAGGIAAASFAAGAIDATAIATDAIGANEVSAAAVTKIQTGLATPTNITAGTITTVTNLTNAPTVGDLTATMKASVTTAATAATPIAASVSGNVGGNVVGSVGSVTALSAAAVQSIWDALTAALTTVGSIGKRLADNVDATISSRLASASYTAPPTAVQNADALLVRDLTAVAAPAARSPMNALRKLMNRISFTAPTLTVYAEDDTTAAYTQTVVQDAAQTPIKSLDTN